MKAQPKPAWIVDASVAVKWFVPRAAEPNWDLARLATRRLAMRTTTLARYEVGNVLAWVGNMKPEQVANALIAMDDICGPAIDLEPADYEVCAKLTQDFGVTFYDASYVAIARRMSRQVLSEDSDLTGPGLARNLDHAIS